MNHGQLIQVRFQSGGRRYTYRVPTEHDPVAVGDVVEVVVQRSRSYKTVEVVAVDVKAPAGIDIADIEAIITRNTPVPAKPAPPSRLLPIVIIPNDNTRPVIIVLSGVQSDAERIANGHGYGNRDYVLATAVVEG